IEGRSLAKKPVEDTGDLFVAKAPMAESATAPVAETTAAPAGVAVVDGKWKMILASPVGPQPMTATFATNGEALTGLLDSDQGAMEFTGTVYGGNLKWDMKVTKPMSLTLKYDVQINGDKLT